MIEKIIYEHIRQRMSEVKISVIPKNLNNNKAVKITRLSTTLKYKELSIFVIFLA